MSDKIHEIVAAYLAGESVSEESNRLLKDGCRNMREKRMWNFFKGCFGVPV